MRRVRNFFTGQSVAFLFGGSILAWGMLASPAAGKQGPPPPPPQPLAGTSLVETQIFRAGAAAFNVAERPEDGLGPVFNGVACAECHRAGGIGGAAPNLGVARVTRIGGKTSTGAYSDLTEVGGPLLQSRSLRELVRNYPVAGEVVPKEAVFVSRRQTTPIFGAGLIEAIPDATIVALAAQPQPDGVKGVINWVTNPETGRKEVGRFGWKAQVSTLHWFSGDAYLNEMGVTNHSFPTENLPQGKPIPTGADLVRDPEEMGSDVDTVAIFMKFLPPLRPIPPDGVAVRGKAIFEQMACTACHVESLQTGLNPSKALSNVTVSLYSDLLLHKMGALADGIQQGSAVGDQFRTAPLWGVGRRPFWLHDGRATTIDQAIRLHDGEALKSKNRFVALNATDRQALIEFLNGL